MSAEQPNSSLSEPQSPSQANVITRRCRDCKVKMELDPRAHHKLRCDDCQKERAKKRARRHYQNQTLDEKNVETSKAVLARMTTEALLELYYARFSVAEIVDLCGPKLNKKEKSRLRQAVFTRLERAEYEPRGYDTRPVPRLCVGWTIRNGTISTCAIPFTQGQAKKKFHSVVCLNQMLRWKKLGYQLGDSIRRTCAYRKCEKGELGTRGVFDRLQRNPSGEYFCTKWHSEAERRARKADKIAERLAEAERILAQHPAKDTGNGTGHKVGRKPDDEGGALVFQLHAQRLHWDAIKLQADRATGVHRSINSWQKVLERYGKRQQLTK